jgi:ribose-phosphate pyrophosphokinase
VVEAQVERFNDGEIFVEVFENVRGEDHVHHPVDLSNPANDSLMELLIMADACAARPSDVTAVLPYFAAMHGRPRTKDPHRPSPPN